MLTRLGLFPEQASALGARVDHLYYFLVIVSGFFAFLIAFLVIYFTIRYHRKSPDEIPPQISFNLPLEIAWTVIPLGIAMVMFVWGADVYFDQNVPPPDAVQMYGIGKQWMWKIQHPEGAREINELHIPVGRPVKLLLTSQDVIHSFFVPAFRAKHDVLPGRYVTVWFTATKAGSYRLFCSEYCGAKHSGMIGWVYAMEPREYERWLTAGAPEGSLASIGQKLFQQHACANCHHLDGQGRCPNLRGLFGDRVWLRDGSQTVADEAYVRESIFDPAAKIVQGYENIMPSFRGQIGEEELTALVEYVKSLGER